MDKRVEGLYDTVDEALKAVDNLRIKGYDRSSITIVANEEVRNRLEDYNQENVTIETETRTELDDRDENLWDSIKDFFTSGNSDETNENDPVYLYRDEIKNGKVVVLVNKDAKPLLDDAEENLDTPIAQDAPNTIGPDGIRNEEEERQVESMGSNPRVDKELTQDELDDYERRQ